MDSRLTIVIPTYNRSGYANRIINYFARYGCPFRIIIADSSEEPHFDLLSHSVKENSSNLYLEHRRWPSSISPQVKFKEVLEDVDTTYVVLLGDDDFLIPSTLRECVDFLEGNPDYSVAHSKALFFALASPDPEKGAFSVVNFYKQRNIEQESPSERLISHIHDYTTTFYSVHRTHQIRKNFETVAQVNLHLRELVPSSLSILQGKVKCIERMGMLRQAHNQSSAERQGLDFFDLITSSAFGSEWALFKEAAYLAADKTLTPPQIESLLKSAFLPYLGTCLAENAGIAPNVVIKHSDSSDPIEANYNSVEAFNPKGFWYWDFIRLYEEVSHISASSLKPSAMRQTVLVPVFSPSDCSFVDALLEYGKSGYVFQVAVLPKEGNLEDWKQPLKFFEDMGILCLNNCGQKISSVEDLHPLGQVESTAIVAVSNSISQRFASGDANFALTVQPIVSKYLEAQLKSQLLLQTSGASIVLSCIDEISTEYIGLCMAVRNSAACLVYCDEGFYRSNETDSEEGVSILDPLALAVAEACPNWVYSHSAHSKLRLQPLEILVLEALSFAALNAWSNCLGFANIISSSSAHSQARMQYSSYPAHRMRLAGSVSDQIPLAEASGLTLIIDGESLLTLSDYISLSSFENLNYPIEVWLPKWCDTNKAIKIKEKYRDKIRERNVIRGLRSDAISLTSSLAVLRASLARSIPVIFIGKLPEVITNVAQDAVIEASSQQSLTEVLNNLASEEFLKQLISNAKKDSLLWGRKGEKWLETLISSI